MAQSTALVLAAGGLVFADRLLNQQRADVVVAVATGAAALVTAGLDVALPGLGRGAAVLLLLGAVLTSGPPVVAALSGDK